MNLSGSKCSRVRLRIHGRNGTSKKKLIAVHPELLLHFVTQNPGPQALIESVAGDMFCHDEYKFSSAQTNSVVGTNCHA